MTTESTPVIVDRIRKLLRLANDPGAFEGEAENAMRMVSALLTRHNLSMGSIDLNRAPDTSDVREKRSKRFSNLVWRQSLAGVIGKHSFCQTILMPSTNGGSFEAIYIGRSANVAVSTETFEWIADQIDVMATSECYRNIGKYRDTWAISFSVGVTLRIGERLAHLRREQEAENNQVRALVIVTGKEVEQYVKDHYKVREGRSTMRVGNESAHRRGFAMGDQVSLHSASRQVGRGRVSLEAGG